MMKKYGRGYVFCGTICLTECDFKMGFVLGELPCNCR